MYLDIRKGNRANGRTVNLLKTTRERHGNFSTLRRESFGHFGGKEQMALHHHSRCEMHEISPEIKRERYVSVLAIIADRV